MCSDWTGMHISSQSISEYFGIVLLIARSHFGVMCKNDGKHETIIFFRYIGAAGGRGADRRAFADADVASGNWVANNTINKYIRKLRGT